MKNESVPIIPLTLRGNNILYRKDPANPVFQCFLSSDIMRQLATNAANVLSTPKEPRDFWLQVLLDGVHTGRQFVFVTSLAEQTEGAQVEVAARTLFQLDGDVLIKIDKDLLTRVDGVEILEAHFGWMEWCLQQLSRVLCVPGILRNIGWAFLVLGVLLFTLGIMFGAASGGSGAGVCLQTLGIVMLMPGHLLLRPAILRHLQWLPPILGVCGASSIILGPGADAVGAWHVNIFPFLSGILSGPAGGRLLRPLAWKAASWIIRRRMDLALQG